MTPLSASLYSGRRGSYFGGFEAFDLVGVEEGFSTTDDLLSEQGRLARADSGDSLDSSFGFNADSAAASPLQASPNMSGSGATGISSSSIAIVTVSDNDDDDRGADEDDYDDRGTNHEAQPRHMSVEILAPPERENIYSEAVGPKFVVDYKGPTDLAVGVDEKLLLVVEGSRWLKVVSNTRPSIKTFLFKVMHSVAQENNRLTFTYIENGDDNPYTFEFIEVATCDDFMQQFPKDAVPQTNVDTSGGGGGGGDGGGVGGGGESNAGGSDVVVDEQHTLPQAHTKASPSITPLAAESDYMEMTIKAAKATGDHSHLKKNRTELHEIKAKVIYEGSMVITRKTQGGGHQKRPGVYYARLRRRAADFRPTFFFEFVKLPTGNATAQDVRDFLANADWRGLVICPYARERGSKPSHVVDFADEYMFEIR